MAKMYLMSSVQKRLYSLDQIQEKNITYNVPMILKISGNFDTTKFENCIGQIIKRHEMFRTRFDVQKGKFLQIIEDNIEFKVEYVQDYEHDIPNVISEFIKPFDLKTTPLIRTKILTYAPDERLLMFDVHHIIMDGVSVGIFLNELVQLYNGFELSENKIQYKDYSAWLSKQSFDNQKEYWQKQFAHGAPQMDIPLDFPRPQMQSFQGDSVSIRLKPEISQKLRELGEINSATDYIVMLAMFMIFLSKYSMSKQVVVGTPIAGRNHPATQEMLGMFVNTLAITQKVDPKLTCQQFLAQVKETCFGAYDNQDYPFEQLAEDLGANKAENRNPIFDIMFTYLSNEKKTIALGEAILQEYPIKSSTAKFDLTFCFGEIDGQYELMLEYNIGLYKRSSIQRMLKHFTTLLEHAVKYPAQQIGMLSCVDDAELQTITTGQSQASSRTDAYVMNGAVLCGIGMPGELCLGWDGFLQKYLNNPNLTERKFTNHPFEDGIRLYRTGDLVRLLETGDIEYLSQVYEHTEKKIMANQQVLTKSHDSNIDMGQAPENEIQEMIVLLFKEILNCDDVCIDKSFFELGGDSIKAIQLISKLREHDYEVRIKDVLNLKTVRAISKVVEQSSIDQSEQGEIIGELRLSPIQSFFYRQAMYAPAHFNQSFMLETNKEVDLLCLKETFRLLLKQHDILRAVFPDGKQVIRPLSQYQEADMLHVNLLNYANAIEEIEAIGSIQQASLNLEQGPLIKSVVYQTTEKWYLQIIVHHLIVDGISWRILLEDINSNYHLLIKGIQPTLPSKTSSYKNWVNMLYQYSKSAAMDTEVVYWKKAEEDILKSQTGRILSNEFANGVSGMCIYAEQISAAEMSQILPELHGDLDMNSLLILSLARALEEICGIDHVSLFMEGHGRETLDSNLKIERTVGWFTCAYPLVLRLLGKTHIEDAKIVKETLQQVPNSGIGYEIINAYRHELKGILPEITFNYLGEFALQSKGGDAFLLSTISGGADISNQNRFGTPISVNSIIVGGELLINIGYDTARVEERFISELAKQYILQIKTVIKQDSLPSTAYEEVYVPPTHKYIKHAVIGTYSPNVMEKMFFGMEDSWLAMELNFTCESPDTFQKAIYEVLRTESIFRTSYTKSGHDYQLIEHDFDKQGSLNYYDIRYATQEKKKIIENQILDAENDLQIRDTKVPSPLYLMTVKRNTEQEYNLRLKISHCIWDKQSDGLFYEKVKNALQDPQNTGHVKSNYAFRNVSEQIRVGDKLKQSDIDSLQEFAGYEAMLKQLTMQHKIIRFDTAVIELGELKQTYSRLPYNVIAHLAKTIILMNGGYNGEKVPLSLIVENRKYVKGAEEVLGLHLDTVPVLIDAKSGILENGASDSIAEYLLLKRESGINIMDWMYNYQKRFSLEGVYTLNIQTGFGLTDQQLLHIIYSLEHRQAGTHYEILANEYKDCIVLAYPVTSACTSDIKNMLNEICKHNFVTTE